VEKKIGSTYRKHQNVHEEFIQKEGYQTKALATEIVDRRIEVEYDWDLMHQDRDRLCKKVTEKSGGGKFHSVA
jgi:hypothetical protein